MDKVDGVHSVDCPDKVDSVGCDVDTDSDDNVLTDQDIADLHAYLTEMDKVRQADPALIPALEDDDGADFADFADQHPDLVKAYLKLHTQYYDVIHKALRIQRQGRQNNGRHEIPDTVKDLLDQVDKEATASMSAIHSDLKDILHYGMISDKSHTAMMTTMPTETDVDGQIRLIWDDLDQSKAGKSAVPIFIALSKSGADMSTDQRITPAHDSVSTTVANIVMAMVWNGNTGPWYITDLDVWRQREFGDWSRTDKEPTKKELQDINRLMTDLRTTLLYMDFSNELKYIKKDKLQDPALASGIIDENYVMATRCRVTTKNGKTMSGYRVYKLPAKYDYAVARGHIVLVDPSLMDVSDQFTRIEPSMYVTEFKEYLLREIELMNQQRRDSTKILYSTAYRDAGVPVPADRVDRAKYSTDESYRARMKTLAKKDRDTIKKILQSWKDKEWITGWQDVKEGKAYVGIRVILNPKRPQAIEIKG